jgi:hypothetical protein
VGRRILAHACFFFRYLLLQRNRADASPTAKFGVRLRTAVWLRVKVLFAAVDAVKGRASLFEAVCFLSSQFIADTG